jgi:hypothetical protein
MFPGVQGWKIYILTGKHLLLEKKDVTYCQIWTAGSGGEYMYGLISWDRISLCDVTKSYSQATKAVVWGTFLPFTSDKLIHNMIY